MKNILLLMVLVVAVLFSSCVFRHTDDLSDLGGNYYFLPDGRMSTIGYNTAKEGENRSGITLVEPKVVDYAFDEKIIIAKSIDVYDEKTKFWIINKDKDLKNNVEQFDSISFYNEISKRNIKLKLNNGSN